MMNVYPRLLVLCLAALLLSPGFVVAEEFKSESINLHHKPVGDIIPLVKPFLHPQGVLSGQDYRILIKSTPANLEEIKKLIADLDTPLHQLEISISFNAAVMKDNKKKKKKRSSDDIANIRVYKSGEDTNVTQLYTTKGEKIDADLYTLRVIEDQWATIRTGHSLPVVERHVNADGTVTQSIRYKQINSGFHVKPKLNADVVTMEISAFSENESSAGGGKLAHHVTTSVIKVNLDEWIPLSASSGQPLTGNNSTIYQTSRRTEQTKQIFLKVDVIP